MRNGTRLSQAGAYFCFVIFCNVCNKVLKHSKKKKMNFELPDITNALGLNNTLSSYVMNLRREKSL